MIFKIKRVVIIIISMVLASFHVNAQTYSVIHVKGKLINKESGKEISRGDKIDEESEIIFDSSDAMAAVISSERGRFILKPDLNNDSNKTSELVGFVKNMIFPAQGGLSTRGGAVNTLFDLKNYLGSRFLILGDRNLISINTITLPMDDDNFFYLTYDYKDEKINKRLRSSVDSLIFDWREIYTIDGNEIEFNRENQVILFYYNQLEKKSTQVTSFDLIVPNQEDIYKEFFVCKENSTDEKSLMVTFHAHIREFYGGIAFSDLKNWLIQFDQNH